MWVSCTPQRFTVTQSHTHSSVSFSSRTAIHIFLKTSFQPATAAGFHSASQRCQKKPVGMMVVEALPRRPDQGRLDRKSEPRDTAEVQSGVHNQQLLMLLDDAPQWPILWLRAETIQTNNLHCSAISISFGSFHPTNQLLGWSHNSNYSLQHHRRSNRSFFFTCLD